MRSIENVECGKMQSVENAELENENCRKCRVWEMRSVENT